MTDCRSCSFFDDILALHPRSKYFGGRNAYGIPLRQICIQSISHPSPRYEKNIKILAPQEHRVSRNETSIFELFSSYFSAILFHFYCRYDDNYGKKTWRRETSIKKNNNNKERHSCDHHLKEKGHITIVLQVGRGSSLS